jgi:hypothetical protein
MREISMTSTQFYFAATILAAVVLAKAVEKAEMILRKIVTCVPKMGL